MPAVISRCGGGTPGGGCYQKIGAGGLDLAVTQDVPGDGILAVCFASYSFGGNGGTGRHPSSGSDPSGVPYTTSSSSKFLVGLAEDDVGTTTIDSVMVGSIMRVCHAGDLVAGDTVHTTWTNTGTGSFGVQSILVYAPVSSTASLQRGFRDYANGDGWPSVAAVQNELHFLTDCFFPPTADIASSSLAVIAGWPAGSYEPADGYLVGSDIGTVGLYVTAIDNILAGTFEPGGAFGYLPTVSVGNYQISIPCVGGGGGGTVGGGRTLARCKDCAKRLLGSS